VCIDVHAGEAARAIALRLFAIPSGHKPDTHKRAANLWRLLSG
jgi:hypothetical protein